MAASDAASLAMAASCGKLQVGYYQSLYSHVVKLTRSTATPYLGEGFL